MGEFERAWWYLVLPFGVAGAIVTSLVTGGGVLAALAGGLYGTVVALLPAAIIGLIREH